MLVTKKLGVKTLAELTARLKAEPGKHNYGAGAISARVAGELYKMLAGVDAVYVGYKNNQLAAPDLNNGIISFMICDVGSAKMILTSGWADALAVTQTEPFPALPGVPSAAQAGMPQPAVHHLVGVLCAQGHAARDRAEAQQGHHRRRHLARDRWPSSRAWRGGPSFTTPEGLMEFTKSEIEAWRKVVARPTSRSNDGRRAPPWRSGALESALRCVAQRRKGARRRPFRFDRRRAYFTNGHLPSLSGR